MRNTFHGVEYGKTAEKFPELKALAPEEQVEPASELALVAMRSQQVVVEMLWETLANCNLRLRGSLLRSISLKAVDLAMGNNGG